MSIRKMRCPKCKHQYEVIFEGKIKRSNPQNRYLHGIILPILSRHTGYTATEMKDLIKSMFLEEELQLKTKNGFRMVKIVKGSAELKTDEFEVFTESVRRWTAQELGCSIPEPNEVVQ